MRGMMAQTSIPRIVQKYWLVREAGGLFWVWRFFREWPVIPIVVVVVLAVVAIFAPLISPQNPYKNDLYDRNAPPAWFADGTSKHILGADPIGRDMASRLVHGARVSVMVMTVALVSGTLVGTSLGLVSGYFGGLTDEVILRIVDMWLGLPFVLVALTLAVVLGPSMTTMMTLLALMTWAGFVRNVRAEVLSLKSRDYVSLASVAGASTVRILVWHLLPGVINTVLVLASLRCGQLILTEAFLSYIGAGIPPPTPTWGSMIADGREYLRQAWWVAIFPGIAIFLAVMSLNFLGDWLRDRLDPRLRQV